MSNAGSQLSMCFPPTPLNVSPSSLGLGGGSFWRVCHRAPQLPSPTDRGPDPAERLGGPRQRGDIVPLATYFFGLWLFDNSGKNSL